MDFRNVKWSKKQYTLKKIIKDNQLPVIVRVIHGCSSETGDMDISKDEVFRLQQVIHERRVQASTRHREYCIPLHYGKRVKVIPKKKTPDRDSMPTYLADLFDNGKKVNLPLTVEFVRMPPVLEEPGVKPVIEGPFNLDQLITKDYILCNRIGSESIDVKVVILPVDVETEVKIAEGLLNGSKTEWTTLIKDLNSITERVNFNMYRGIKDVKITPLTKRSRLQSEGNTTMPTRNPVRGEAAWRRRSEPFRITSPIRAAPLPTPMDRPMHGPSIDTRYSNADMSYGPPPPYTQIDGNLITGPRSPRNNPRSPIYNPYVPLDINYNPLPTPPSTKNTWSSLPDRVDDFTVADVCNSLKLLGIHTHYEIFKEKDIDGVKLKTYDLNRMTKELDMQPRDALTLDKLIERGKPAD